MDATQLPPRRYWRLDGPCDASRPVCDACGVTIERGEPVAVIGKCFGVTDVYHARCEWGPVPAEAVAS